MSFETSGETVFEGEQKIVERSGKKQYNLENSVPVEVGWNLLSTQEVDQKR